jgi:hypothetical protein
MPNLIYRNRLINNIQYAIREAENAAHVNHPGLTGLIRELVASQIFAHIMPGGFEIGKGKLIDRNGKLSSEGDLLVYNHSILPPIMYSERDGIYPIESSYYAFEIKSQSTASNIQDAIRKGRAIIELDYPTKEEKNNNRNASITVMVFFAFGSDLAKNSSEFDRYAKYDPDWKNDPVIKVICVVGSATGITEKIVVGIFSLRRILLMKCFALSHILSIRCYVIRHSRGRQGLEITCIHQKTLRRKPEQTRSNLS